MEPCRFCAVRVKGMINVLKTRLLACAAVALAAVAAHASFVDATILVERAANSKTLSVRYEGANAALVELRINGVSVASRQVSADTANGETNFTLDTANLEDGENKVEIVLYDVNNKVVGTQKTTIKIDRKGEGPVTITAPRSNDNAQGIVEIKLGFRQELKNVYVSFFVNDEFKILKNFPPYSYRWDTTSVPNGWHEIQAWVVDEANATFKTDKLRIYVNNPGGQTKRTENPLGKPVAPANPTPANPKPVKPDPSKPVKPAPNKPVEPALPVKPDLNPGVSGNKGAKPIDGNSGLATGTRLMNPKSPDKQGTANTQTPAGVNGDNSVVAVSVRNPDTAPKLKPVGIGFGTRLADRDHMDVYVDGAKVDFDVSPRITDGVPLSPFRHLYEANGGKVKWDNKAKRVDGESENLKLSFTVGNPNATVNGSTVVMEAAPFIEAGRTIVPLSFIGEALQVNVMFDPATGHVLILSAKSR